MCNRAACSALHCWAWHCVADRSPPGHCVVEQQTLRRDTVKEASADGICCVGSTPMVRGCAANPPCYSAVVGSLVSMERLHLDFGGAGYMFRMCVVA